MVSNAGKRAPASLPATSRPAIGFRVPRLRFEVRLAGLLLLLAIPTLLFAGLYFSSIHTSLVLDAGAFAVLLLLLYSAASAVFRHIVHPLQTLSNVVAALRENEYSFRAREVGAGDALGDLAAQINELASDLRTRRHRETETYALLERVVETMDMPVFAFDASSSLQLTNPAASKLLQQPAEALLHRSAAALGLNEILSCSENSIASLTMHGREARWMVRRSKFYQNGMPHTLLLLSDVSGVLREQERQAWQRLIRVLAHEVNNSLTPIKSIAGSLRMGIQQPRTEESDMPRRQMTRAINPVDLEHGLAIIEERAESLNKFLQAYSQLAKLPPPIKDRFPLTPLLARVCHLETRLPVTLHSVEPVLIYADASQLEQALINLVRNAVDAVQETEKIPLGPAREAPSVAVRCSVSQEHISISVEDNGPGLANPANLFIPFYTTKPGGTGIGLILALQIVEAHGGALTLTNRSDTHGCCAEVRLPVVSAIHSYASSAL
jgi:two-component system nitrogen regulation sensor histidine kinase NtrY